MCLHLKFTAIPFRPSGDAMHPSIVGCEQKIGARKRRHRIGFPITFSLSKKLAKFDVLREGRTDLDGSVGFVRSHSAVRRRVPDLIIHFARERWVS